MVYIWFLHTNYLLIFICLCQLGVSEVYMVHPIVQPNEPSRTCVYELSLLEGPQRVRTHILELISQYSGPSVNFSILLDPCMFSRLFDPL